MTWSRRSSPFRQDKDYESATEAIFENLGIMPLLGASVETADRLRRDTR